MSEKSKVLTMHNKNWKLCQKIWIHIGTLLKFIKYFQYLLLLWTYYQIFHLTCGDPGCFSIWVSSAKRNRTSLYETEGSLMASMPFAEAEVLISASLLELDTLGGRSCSREDRLSPSYRCLQAPLVALLLEGILTLSLKLTTLSMKYENDITFLS